MDKIALEKNILDLSYRRNLQLLNIVLISALGAIFAYVGAVILNPEKLLPYTLVLILVGLITYAIYRKLNENFKEISKKIKDLI